MKVLLPAIALVLLGESACPAPVRPLARAAPPSRSSSSANPRLPPSYLYDTDLQPFLVGGKPNYNIRMVPKDKPPISPVKFGQWLMPSSWAKQLATRWAELPFVFDATGPEYCSALGVDKDRMLHVSTPVRYRDDSKAGKRCPMLIWTGDAFMIGLSAGTHSHPTLQIHGERISIQDASMGGPVLTGLDSEARVELSRVAVSFFSGERLMGINLATGKEAPVPAQSLFFTRFDGAVHVFLWTPLGGEAKGKSNFVRVYRPASDDRWEEVGICWADTREAQQAETLDFHPPVRCNPNDFWLR